MKKYIITAMAGVSLLLTLALGAEPAKSEKQAGNAIQYRQAIFQLIKSNVGAMGAMAKGAIPFDAAVLATNASRVEQLSLMLQDYFATDTSSFDIESDTLIKVWTDKQDFTKKINSLTKAASNLETVANSGEQSQFKGAISQVFKSCKGCHNDYRKD